VATGRVEIPYAEEVELAELAEALDALEPVAMTSDGSTGHFRRTRG
jgi:hypothetical protein